jgi:hypothetical protein
MADLEIAKIEEKAAGFFAEMEMAAAGHRV